MLCILYGYKMSRLCIIIRLCIIAWFAFFERKKSCSPYMIMIIYLLRNSYLYGYALCDSFLVIITNYVLFIDLGRIKRDGA